LRQRFVNRCFGSTKFEKFMIELILYLASLSLFLGWLVWFMFKRRKEMKEFNKRMSKNFKDLEDAKYKR